MKLRILIYGALIILICALATVYLVYINRDRILEAAGYKLSIVARDKWGVELESGGSRLNIHQNSVVFRDLTLSREDGSLTLKVAKLEMEYDLGKLLGGEVYFDRIALELPKLELKLGGAGAAEEEGGGVAAFFKPREVLAALAVARRIDLDKGSILVTDQEGRMRFAADGVEAVISISESSIETKGLINTVKVDYGKYRGLFRQAALQGILDKEGFALKWLTANTDAGRLEAGGRIGGGAGRADFKAKVDLEKFRESIEGLLPMSGTVDAAGNLVVDRTGWSLKGEVKTNRFTIGGEPIPDAKARVELYPDRCLFSGIESRPREGGTLSGEGGLEWASGRFAYGFRVRAAGVLPSSVEYVRRNIPAVIVEPAGAMTGSLAFDVEQVLESEGTLSVRLDLAGPVPRYLGAAEARISGTVESAGAGRLRMRAFSIVSGPLDASWEGHIEHDGSLSLALTARSGDLSTSLAPFGLEWLGGRAEFTGEVTGSGPSLTVGGGITVGPASVRGVGYDRISGRIVYRGGIYTAGDVTVHKGAGVATLAGSVSVKEGTFLQGNISLSAMPAVDGRTLLDLEIPLEGDISGKLSLAGSPESLAGTGSLSSAALKVRGVELLEAFGDFAFTPGIVIFKDLQATVAGGRSFFAGRWRKEGIVEGEVKGNLPDIGRILPGRGLEGSMEYRGKVAGRIADPDFEGWISLRGARVEGAPLPDLETDVGKKEDKVKGAGLVMGRHSLSWEADLSPPRALRGSAVFANLDLADVLPYVGTLVSRKAGEFLASCEARGGGRLTFNVPLDRPGGFEATVRLENLQAAVSGVTSRLQEPVEVAFSRSGIAIDRAVIRGENHRVLVRGSMEGGKLALAVEGALDLSFLGGRTPLVTRVGLAPEVAVEIGGTIDEPIITGRAKVKGGSLSLKGLKSDLREVGAQVEFDRRRITVSEFSAGLGEGGVKGSGWYDLGNRGIQASLQGNFNLAALDWKIGGIKEYEGRGTFEAEVTGWLDLPLVDARVKVNDGLVRFDAFPTPLREVNLTLSISDEFIRLEEAHAKVNGGMTDISGYLVWPWEGRLEEVNLDITARKLYLYYPDTLKLESSAELSLSGAPEALVLKGEVVLERGKYFKDMAPRPVVDFTRESDTMIREGTSKNPIISNLTMDLHLIAEQGFWIDNNVAQINTGLDLRLKGTPAEPLLSGEIRVQDGSIYYLGKKFTLRETYMLFQGKYPIDPYLNVQADTVVASTTIHLVYQGNLSTPKNFELSSDPSYSREDIISLLTLGTRRSYVEGKGRDVSAMGAAMVFTEPVLGKLEGGTRSFTGLEVFQIEPTLSDSGGAARLVMGKQLSDRIFLSYSRNLAGTGEDQFSMEYKLFDFLSLVGKQDHEGLYNIDVVFTFEGFRWPGP